MGSASALKTALITLAKMVDTWWPEMNAFITIGITNAKTEGYGRLVKQVERSACVRRQYLRTTIDRVGSRLREVDRQPHERSH